MVRVMSNINIMFSRTLLKAVMEEVKKHATADEIKQAWVYHFDRDSWEVRIAINRARTTSCPNPKRSIGTDRRTMRSMPVRKGGRRGSTSSTRRKRMANMITLEVQVVVQTRMASLTQRAIAKLERSGISVVSVERTANRATIHGTLKVKAKEPT